MKAIPYILTLCCLLSCTTPADVTPLLEQAEQLMNVRPDSALTLLESIPEPEELSKRHRARWGLLLTQARDKNYVPHTSDSLITTVIDYYRTHNDPRRLAWAYYYDGIIHYELEEFELSQAALLKAEEAAAKVADFDLLGRVYENFGNIYRKQGLTDLVLPMHRKALDANVKLNDSLGIGIAYRNIGRHYLTNDLDSAENYLKQALVWLQYEPNRLSHVLNDLGRVYRRKQNYEKSLVFIKQSLVLFVNKTQSLNPVYLNLADTYSKLGQLDSAIVYFQRCLEDPKTRTSAHGALSDIYSQKGDYQKAYTYGNRYAVLLDSVYRSEKAAELAKQLEKHEKEKAIVQLERKHAESKFFYFIVGMLIIISSLSIALVFVEKNRRKKDELLKVSKEIAIIQQKYLQMVERDDKMEELRHFCLKNSAIYCYLEPLIEKKRDVKDFKCREYKVQDWEDFFQRMDFVYIGFVTRLREKYNLSHEHIKLSCLILLEISPSNVANALHITQSAVSNKRNSLAKRLSISKDELFTFLQAFSKG